MKEVELEWELRGARGRSRDREGVERGEKEGDFRRERGKKPRVRGERRAISMGWGKGGRETQEAWV